MRYVPVLGLGTYYTANAMRNWASDVPGAPEMHAWTYHSKEWYAPEVRFRHPSSEDQRKQVIGGPAESGTYAASIGKTLIGQAFDGLDFPPTKTFIVPIPSSATTRLTAVGRWPALRLARALEAAGVGRVLLKLYFRRQRPSKHLTKGSTAPDDARPIFDDLDVDQSIFLPPWAHVIYVDDVLTWGTHVAAVHHALDCPKKALGFTIGSTDSSRVENALEPRLRNVKYQSLELVELEEAVTRS